MFAVRVIRDPTVQNIVAMNVEVGGTYGYHSALKG
jgi:hypothetical protein